MPAEILDTTYIMCAFAAGLRIKMFLFFFCWAADIYTKNGSSLRHSTMAQRSPLLFLEPRSEVFFFGGGEGMTLLEQEGASFCDKSFGVMCCTMPKKRIFRFFSRACLSGTVQSFYFNSVAPPPWLKKISLKLSVIHQSRVVGWSGYLWISSKSRATGHID